MTRNQIRRYLEVIPTLRAEEQLEAAHVAQFPYMTAPGRQAAIRQWETTAGFQAKSEIPEVPRHMIRDFFASLRGSRGD